MSRDRRELVDLQSALVGLIHAVVNFERHRRSVDADAVDAVRRRTERRIDILRSRIAEVEARAA